jgi:hypothetical protein
MKNKILIFLLLIFILSAFFIFFSQRAGAAVTLTKPVWNGIVPCGRNEGTVEEMAPCTLCHLIIGFERLVQYGLYLVTTLAFVGLFLAGALYVISSGDEGMMTAAKKFLTSSLIGFTVVLGAWLIINITFWAINATESLPSSIKKPNWYTFTCDTKSSAVINTSTP